MKDSTLYLSMYGNVCDRIRVEHSEAMTVLRWLDAGRTGLNPDTQSRVRDWMGQFTLGEVSPTSVEFDYGAGPIAIIRYAVAAAMSWARELAEVTK